MSSEKQQINGSCLCGAVAIKISPPSNTFGACHCGMCRKWASGPIMTVEGGDHPELSGKDSIAIYSSSEWAERGFCKHCGTHLFYRFKGSNSGFFSIGLFKETENFKFSTQIYIDAKPSCYEFANETETMTEAEVMTKFSQN